jgi:SAM-dependent methyltransferase
MKAYYEAYWSPEGFHPEGGLPDQLRALLQPFVSRTTRSLDVGCGDGRTCGRWLQQHAGSYVGVDISENSLKEAAALGLDTRLIRDASSLPFPDDSFDLVVCIEVFEHLFAPQTAAREILRVLRPGAVLVATVPNVAYWRRRLDLALFGRWHPMGDDRSVDQPWRDPHIRFFNEDSLLGMLGGVGFTSVAVGGYQGALMRDIPLVRRLAPRASASWLYRRAERVLPSVLALRLHALARKSE